MGQGIESRLQIYGPLIVRAFLKHGLPPVWGLAIAGHESKFDPTRVNMKGKDGKRGGAWGLFQVTLQTARDLDTSITTDRLLIPETNTEFAARLCADANKRYPGDIVKALSIYNSGKILESPKMTDDARRNVLDYLAAVQPLVPKYQGAADRFEKQLRDIPANNV